MCRTERPRFSFVMTKSRRMERRSMHWSKRYSCVSLSLSLPLPPSLILPFPLFSFFPQNLDYFKATEDSEIWQHYLDYLDDIMVDGLFNCIHCSLRYLLENTDKEAATMIPLLEVKLELQV